MITLSNLRIFTLVITMACSFCVLRADDQELPMVAIKKAVPASKTHIETATKVQIPIAINQDALQGYNNLVGTVIIGSGVSGMNAALITARARIPTVLIGRTRVVFPAPFCPTIATCSPALMVNETPLIASKPVG